MRVKVVVMPPGKFNAWLQKRAAPAKAAPAGGKPAAATPAQGKAVFAAGGCGACHTLSDAGATGKVGPDLDHVVADAKKYGKGQSPQAYITQSIEDPNAFVVPGFPKNVMPQNFKTQLGPGKIDALRSYGG